MNILVSCVVTNGLIELTVKKGLFQKGAPNASIDIGRRDT
jgi:hypothetical protein